MSLADEKETLILGLAELLAAQQLGKALKPTVETGRGNADLSP